MTLRTNARRPGVQWLALVAGILVLLVGAATAVLALISDGPGTFDITVEDTSGDETADLGNATVRYIGSDSDNSASGTGLFDPFVRLQGAPTEDGYNTCSQASCGGDVTEFETKPGKWTKAILASAIPVVDCGGDLAGTDCWELFVDINEGNNAKHISLNEVEIWLTTDPRITGYDGGFDAPAEQVYDFTGDILIHDVNQGSGRGDLLYLVPVQPFDAGDFFVLYSEWGTTGTLDSTSYNSEGGFEEWKVRKAPNVTIVKTADAASVNAGQTIAFTITVTNNGAADATGVTISDPLPAGTGIDWAEAPTDNPNCSIAGTPPNETLNCGPVTLAAGGGSLSVHVQSATTAASCGTYNNTASFTSTNAGSGSDSASVTVNCAAIRIVKQSTKTGNPLVSTEGAVFSITGPGGYSNSVTDDNVAGVEDEDTTIGEVCISGLAPGTYTVNETTPPTGYGGATQTNLSAVAAVGTNCTTNQPTATDSATFTNAPLGEIEVLFSDLGSGETASSIVCVEGTTTIPAVDENGDPDPAFDDTDEVFTNLDPGTYTCTVVIDP
jgi:uncharacterized repeat protein (TIGR01451 family)